MKDFRLYIAIGALLVYGLYYLDHIARSRRARYWPVVEGTIIKADPIPEEVRSANPFTYRRRLPRKLRGTLDISYRYTFAGREYVSDQITFPAFGRGTGPEVEAEAEAAAAGWKVGDRVPVRVNPDNPKESVLFPGPFRSVVVAATVCLSLAVLVAAIALLL